MGAALLFMSEGLAAQEIPDFAEVEGTPEVSLREAIDLALVNSPAAVAARVGTENAEAGKREAFGDFLPSLNVGSSFANSSNERFDQTTGQLVSESYTAQVTASYEIFSFGRRIAANRAAGARLAAAIANERDQNFAVALATTQIYYDVAAAQELARVARQRIERARAQLEFAEARLELGTVTRSDVLRAELELSNAELALLDAEVAFRTGALQLGRQVGISGAVRTVDTALPEDVPLLPELSVLADIAEREAPPVLSAEANVKDRTAQKQTVWTQYAPSLRVNGGYDWFDFEFPPRTQSWSFRVTASLPVFDGFSREANLWRNQAQERLAQAQYRDAVIGARVDVEDAWLRIQAADRRVSIAERGLALAQEDLRVQEERYQLGVATIVELQTSQVALADAENAWVLERQNLGLALAQLEAVLGRSIEDLNS
ncbi:MAG: TolC family protein [Gemmatimonadota bacterium]